MKKVKFILVLFLSFYLLSASFLIFLAPSTKAITWNETFDDELDGQQASQGQWFITGDGSQYDYHEVDNTYSRSGALSFRSRVGGTSGISGTWNGGWWNFSIASTYQIETMTYYTFMPFTATGSTPRCQLYFKDELNQTLFYLHYAYGNGDGKANFDINSISELVELSRTHWTKLVITRISTTQVNISIFNGTTDAIIYGELVGLTNNVWANFSHIYFYGFSTNTHTYMYFDDLELDTQGIVSTEYTKIGYGAELPTSHSAGTGGWRRILEWKYYGRLNTTVREFEVVMQGFTSFYLTYTEATTDDVTLFINGWDAGHPSTVIVNGWASNHDIVRWTGLEIPISLDDVNNGNIVFELKSDFSPHLLSSNFVTNWWVGGGPIITSTDMYGDDDVKTYHHYHSGTDGLLDKLNGMSYDVISAFWIDRGFDIYWDEPSGSTGDYIDELATDKDDYIARVETVHIYGHADHLRYTNTLHIYRNTVEITDLTFPRLILSYEINEFFTPEQPGSYEIRLYRAGEKRATAFFNATAPQDENANFSLWTDPNPSMGGESYEINYVYNHAENRIGKIVITQSENFYDALNSGSSRFNQWYIMTNNLNGSVFDIRGLTGCYYLVMGVSLNNETNGTFSSVAYTEHFVKSSLESKISPTKESISLNQDEVGNILPATVMLDFQHNLIGQNVHILVNGKRITDYGLGCSPSGVYLYSAETAGQYMAQLVIINDTDYVEFAFCNFTVHEPDYLQDVPFLPSLDPWLGGLAGLVITLVCLFLPVTLTRDKNIKIPYPVYAMSGGVGISISIIFGFFELWIPFFIIIIGIIVSVVFHFSKKEG